MFRKCSKTESWHLTRRALKQAQWPVPTGGGRVGGALARCVFAGSLGRFIKPFKSLLKACTKLLKLMYKDC